jgi:hypothetical protein
MNQRFVLPIFGFYQRCINQRQMSENMVKRKGMLTAMNILSHQKSRKGQSGYIRPETELQFEIECPRCYDTMQLSSDFNGLHYFCEQCGFLLHTYKATGM